MPVKKRSNHSRKPLILVSNDDGVYAEGIRVLAKQLTKIGRVVVVAPDQERSTSSHALTLHRPLRVKKIKENFFAVNGTPADCVTVAVKEILPRHPDIIVSGINNSANVGDDVHYSGTVSAALEGGIMDIQGIAASLSKPSTLRYTSFSRFIVKLAKKVLKEGLPAGVILNVNYPPCAPEKVKGYKFTRQGKRDYGNVLAERIDPRGRTYYWIGGSSNSVVNIPGTDGNAFLNNFISITSIRVY